MKSPIPPLPEYGFSWRSIQIEPIPSSGERITIGTIVKGDDQALIAARLIAATRIKSMYGQEFGNRVTDALSLCMNYAEKFYKAHPLSSKWEPPLDGFYLSNISSSLAEDIDDALIVAAMHCSSFSLSLEASKLLPDSKSELSAPKSWRNEIFKAVTSARSEFSHYFEQKVQIKGSGVPLKIGFLSENYAAQFDAIAETKGIQHALVRAQSKLWQLDRLRDGDSLFKPELCELLLQTPLISEDGSTAELNDFVDELKYEASKRELGIYTTNSYKEAAQHIIQIAA